MFVRLEKSQLVTCYADGFQRPFPSLFTAGVYFVVEDLSAELDEPGTDFLDVLGFGTVELSAGSWHRVDDRGLTCGRLGTALILN